LNAGDGVTRDKDGYYWIRGRVDDVINVSGHRISTAEVESALILHPQCAEAAVVGVPDDLTGQAIFVFASLKDVPTTPMSATHDLGTSREHLMEKAAQSDRDEMIKKTAQSLVMQIRSHIGSFASAKKVIVVRSALSGDLLTN